VTYGKPGNALDALLAAEQFAPEEVCRPSVQAITTSLLRARTHQSPELHAFATRCGAAP
jgi:hypothetical protein